jgi:hypothetical protein
MLFVILLLVGTSFALTAKIGNPRVVLYPEVTPTQPAYINRNLEVINDNDIIVNIKMDVTPDNCTDIIKISAAESSFSLQPQQTKNVPFVVKVVQPGFYDCNVNTYFKEENNTGPGVALASAVIIKATGKGPEVTPVDTSTNATVPPNNVTVGNPDDNGVTGGVSVRPGGEIKIDKKPDYNIFVISFFVLMLVVVILLAVFVMRKRRRSVEDEIKKVKK